MTTAHSTPVRDQLISIAEGVHGEVWDHLEGSCSDCTGSLTGWCAPHAESCARVDEIAPILFRLHAASTDGEALAVVAALPSLALAAQAEGPVAA